eukprot:scaffold91715_cov50-Phaeocystis_antarctica.AAC.3
MHAPGQLLPRALGLLPVTPVTIATPCGSYEGVTLPLTPTLTRTRTRTRTRTPTRTRTRTRTRTPTPTLCIRRRDAARRVDDRRRLDYARRRLHAGRVPRHAAVRCGGQDPGELHPGRPATHTCRALLWTPSPNLGQTDPARRGYGAARTTLLEPLSLTLTLTLTLALTLALALTRRCPHCSTRSYRPTSVAVPYCCWTPCSPREVTNPNPSPNPLITVPPRLVRSGQLRTSQRPATHRIQSGSAVAAVRVLVEKGARPEDIVFVNLVCCRHTYCA